MGYLAHRFAAAFLAISARRSGVMLLARAAPPFLPSAFAAGSLPSSGGASSISPVAIRAIIAARAFTSAGRFWPLGPRGTELPQMHFQFGYPLAKCGYLFRR